MWGECEQRDKDEKRTRIIERSFDQNETEELPEYL